MPIYELRNDKKQVRFVPGHDETVTVFTYEMIDDVTPGRYRNSQTMPLKLARSYWCGLLRQGFDRRN